MLWKYIMSVSKGCSVISLDGFSGIAYLLDQSGRVVDCNKEMEIAIGVTREDILFHRFVDFDANTGVLIDGLHDTMLGNVEESVASPIVGFGSSYAQVVDLLDLDCGDRRLMLSMEKRLIKDRNGNNLGLLSVGFDLENAKDEVIELSTFKELLNEHKQLLETILYKARMAASVAADQDEALVDASEKDKFAKFKMHVDQFSEDLSFSCSKLNRISVDKFIVSQVNKGQGLFYYRLLYVSDHGALSAYYNELVSNECFNPYVCSVEEFEDELVFWSKLGSGFFDLLIVEACNNRIPSWTWKVSDRCLVFVVGNFNESSKNNILTNRAYFISDENEVGVVDQIFSQWNISKVEHVRERVWKQGCFNVLIVEDYAESRESLAELVDVLLEAYDLNFATNIVTAVNGSEAFNFAVNITFDLIILDLGLPDITGFEVAKKLRSLEQIGNLTYSYIVVNTGHCFDLVMSHERVQKYGFDQVYLKPSLASSIDGILRQFVDENARCVEAECGV